VTTNGDGVMSVSSSTTAVCSVDGSGVVSYVGAGTCTLVAHVAAGVNLGSADGQTQSFTVGKGTPSSPTLSLPSLGDLVVGGSFLPTVSTTGDGAKSVTTSSPNVCTVNRYGRVTFIKAGTCTLVARVAEGTNFNVANGVGQSFTVGKGTPSSPTLSLPSLGNRVVGGSFLPTVSTTGDGVKSVTSSTPAVCSVNSVSGRLTLIKAGTCTLVARVAAGMNFNAAIGVAQSFTVGKGTPSAPISSLPTLGRRVVGGSFIPKFVTTGDGAKSVTTSSPDVCSVNRDGRVTFLKAGRCRLVAHVAAGVNYNARDGVAQSFKVV
jgi:hypothetical protein